MNNGEQIMILNVRELPQVEIRGIVFYYKAPDVAVADPDRIEWGIYSVMSECNRPVRAQIGIVGATEDGCFGHLITSQKTKKIGDDMIFNKHEARLLLDVSSIRYASAE
jgi:hypothetical protein